MADNTVDDGCSNENQGMFQLPSTGVSANGDGQPAGTEAAAGSPTSTSYNGSLPLLQQPTASTRPPTPENAAPSNSRPAFSPTFIVRAAQALNWPLRSSGDPSSSQAGPSRQFDPTSPTFTPTEAQTIDGQAAESQPVAGQTTGVVEKSQAGTVQQEKENPNRSQSLNIEVAPTDQSEPSTFKSPQRNQSASSLDGSWYRRNFLGDKVGDFNSHGGTYVEEPPTTSTSNTNESGYNSSQVRRQTLPMTSDSASNNPLSMKVKIINAVQDKAKVLKDVGNRAKTAISFRRRAEMTEGRVLETRVLMANEAGPATLRRGPRMTWNLRGAGGTSIFGRRNSQATGAARDPATIDGIGNAAREDRREGNFESGYVAEDPNVAEDPKGPEPSTDVLPGATLDGVQEATDAAIISKFATMTKKVSRKLSKGFSSLRFKKRNEDVVVLAVPALPGTILPGEAVPSLAFAAGVLSAPAVPEAPVVGPVVTV